MSISSYLGYIRDPERFAAIRHHFPCLGHKSDKTIENRKNGAPGGSRTPDLRIRSPLLYPAELLARSENFWRGKISNTHDIYPLSYFPFPPVLSRLL